MKMVDRLLFIYLLSLVLLSSFRMRGMLTPGRVSGACSSNLCFHARPAFVPAPPPLRGQIGGGEEANVISAALGGNG